MADPLIQVDGLFKIFGENPQSVMPLVRDGRSKDDILAETGHTVGLIDINLGIDEGETFVVMGLSGSGKSTLIRHFNRLIEPTAGTIHVDGTDVMTLSRTALEGFRRHKMSMVFQRFGLLPHRTVLENVAYGLSVQGTAKDEQNKKARHWLRQVGLEGYEDQYPAQLSGGQQQRVGLARALCTDAEILLMDEPFSALDPLIRSEMQETLITLQNELHKTIIFITHDLDEALRLGDRIAILKGGALTQIGRPAEILLDPADDYVAAFVRDVNRARVVSVEVAMQPADRALTATDAGGALSEMRDRNWPHGFVFDAEGYRGVVKRSALEDLCATPDGAAAGLSTVVQPGPALRPRTVLQEALEAVLRSTIPVPVIAKDGTFRGTLSRGDVLAILAGESARPDDFA